MQKNQIVCKFGGSSVADAGQFKKIRTIVESNQNRSVVVVSAPGKRNPSETKLTDLLYSVHALGSKGEDFSQPYGLIRDRFIEIARDLHLDTDVGTALNEIEQHLKHNPQTSVSWVVSRGEYLSARLMSEYLGWEFIDAFDLISIDESKRMTKEGYDYISMRLKNLDRVVVPGFYAKSKEGELVTFSRGGSDITGAILANAIDASVYENWTDVSGLMMADPRIIHSPLPMPYVSYREIRELSYSGANVLHDEAIVPCKAKNIPINIRNTERPEDEGTIIGPNDKGRERGIVTGIAGRRNFSMIYIDKDMMNKERGFGARVMGILEEFGISYEHAPTGIDSMSVIMETAQLAPVEERLIEALKVRLEPNKIKIFHELALIATVGHGMTGQIGVAARLFTALANAEVNIRTIAQGSSEINIIVGVDHSDFDRAIEAIYSEFVVS